MCCRTQYERSVIPRRSESIVRAIIEHRPSVAVFYGRRKFWRRRLNVAGPFANPLFDSAKIGSTNAILTDHPGAWSNDALLRFTTIGEYLRGAF
jgi:hypothetical protein